MTTTANVNSINNGHPLFSNTNSLSSGNVNVLSNSFRSGIAAVNATALKGGGIPFLQGGKRRNTINRRRIRQISKRYKTRGNKTFRKQMRSRLLRKTRHNRK